MFLGKKAQYVDPDAVLGDESHLNATLPPNDPAAGSDFAYLTVDGSEDAGYIPAQGSAALAHALTYGGAQVTYGGVPLTYGA